MLRRKKFVWKFYYGGPCRFITIFRAHYKKKKLQKLLCELVGLFFSSLLSLSIWFHLYPIYFAITILCAFVSLLWSQQISICRHTRSATLQWCGAGNGNHTRRKKYHIIIIYTMCWFKTDKPFYKVFCLQTDFKINALQCLLWNICLSWWYSFILDCTKK